MNAMNKVTVIWETWLNSGSEDKGLALTRRIWTDMTLFQGYMSHSILIDEDDKGHLLVVSEWTTREGFESLGDSCENLQCQGLSKRFLVSEYH